MLHSANTGAALEKPDAQKQQTRQMPGLSFAVNGAAG